MTYFVLIDVGVILLAIVAVIGEQIKNSRGQETLAKVEQVVWFEAFVEADAQVYTVQTRVTSDDSWKSQFDTYNDARDLVVERVLGTTVGAEPWVDLGGQMIKKELITRWGVKDSHYGLRRLRSL